jgi:hypothetical protein
MNQGACPNSLSFHCFHFIFTFESIKELGSALMIMIYGDEFVNNIRSQDWKAQLGNLVVNIDATQ